MLEKSLSSLLPPVIKAERGRVLFVCINADSHKSNG